AAAFAARRNADAHIVIELATDESLGNLEQTSHDHALQTDAVLAAEAAGQDSGAIGIGAEREELATNLGMRAPPALRFAIPLRLGAGWEIVAMWLVDLGLRCVEVDAGWERGSPPC